MKKISEADFWSKANCKNEDQCWEWIRSLSLDGYGKCLFLGEQLAHRISYRLKVGAIPKGMCVLHSCDNRKCINPKHLFIGNRIDNNTDRNMKGRQAKGQSHGSVTKPGCSPHGETHTQAKLSTKDVNMIRLRYAQGNISQRTLAKDYNVGHSTIGAIVRGEMRKKG